MYVRGYKDGMRFFSKEKYKPFLFLPTKTESKYRTIHGEALKKVDFDSPSAMWQFGNQYKDIAGFKYYGMDDSILQYISTEYPDVATDYDPSLIRTCIIDIEVDTTDGYPDIDTANRAVTAITMIYKDITFALGYGDFTPTDNKVKYFKCKDEDELLKKFLKIWDSARFCPDAVSGWNIETFDIPYLVNRITRIMSYEEAQRLSPWRHLQERKIEIFGRDHQVFYPAGVAVLDYLVMYKKFIAVLKPQESYRLDHIAYVELNERKLDYTAFGSLHRLAAEDHQKFMEYNVRDCELVERIDQKYNLFRLVYNVAYSTGVNFGDAIGTVRSWDAAISNYLMKQCVIIPTKEKPKFTRRPVGGYVKEPLKGNYKWVVSFDLTSLYPHIIMQYNIGPDTFVKQLPEEYTADDIIAGKHLAKYGDWLAENNYCLAANSCVYRKDKKSFLSQLMEDLFQKRKEVKDEMKDLERRKAAGEKGLDDKISELDTLQYSIKVRLNGAYGALGNMYFRWYDIKYAESITLSGQLTVKWAQHYVNEYMNKIAGTTDVDYIIMIDTDSIYVNMEPVVAGISSKKRDEILQHVDDACENDFNPFLNDIFENLRKTMNAPKQAMHMKREAIADRGVFIAKKRYIMNVLDNEGVRYAEPDCKIVGVGSRRSDTPSSCRESIAEVARIAVQGDEQEMHEYIKAFEDRYATLPYEEIAKNTSVKGLTTYHCSVNMYKSKTPAHVRAAMVYNRLVKDLGLEKQLEPIFEGEKIKWCYVRLPNPGRENVIAGPNGLPKEIGMDEYVDRDTQYEKTFLSPVTDILDVVGWTTEPVNRVSGFYS